MITLLVIICILLLIQFVNMNQDPGYVVYKNLLSNDEVRYILSMWDISNYRVIKNYFMESESIKRKLSKLLGDDYVLIHYSYLIENSTIHTFHRDYTSSRRFNSLQHPSYTMILYLDSDKSSGLTLIPGSHTHTLPIYVANPAIKLSFNKGDAVIFDADLFQFKIIHKNDIHKMPWLNNFHVLINRPNNKSKIVKNIETHTTKHAPFLMDINQSFIKTAFGEEKTDIQKFVSKYVFSNEDFYKPIKI